MGRCFVLLGISLRGAWWLTVKQRVLFGAQAPIALLAGLGVAMSIPSSHCQPPQGRGKTTLQKLAGIDYAGALTLVSRFPSFIPCSALSNQDKSNRPDNDDNPPPALPHTSSPPAALPPLPLLRHSLPAHRTLSPLSPFAFVYPPLPPDPPLFPRPTPLHGLPLGRPLLHAHLHALSPRSLPQRGRDNPHPHQRGVRIGRARRGLCTYSPD